MKGSSSLLKGKQIGLYGFTFVDMSGRKIRDNNHFVVSNSLE